MIAFSTTTSAPTRRRMQFERSRDRPRDPHVVLVPARPFEGHRAIVSPAAPARNQCLTSGAWERQVRRGGAPDLEFARVWGARAELDGQQGSAGHVVRDRDVAELHG